MRAGAQEYGVERVVHELERASDQMSADLAADDINLRRIQQYCTRTHADTHTH